MRIYLVVMANQKRAMGVSIYPMAFLIGGIG
jgi:hypothetical protein